jgi:membrane protease YdiL (CAAX protease family)
MSNTTSKVVSSMKPIYLFLSLVTVFAAIGYMVAFRMGDDDRMVGIILVQFSPMIAAFITRLVFQGNIRGFGWGLGKARYQFGVYVIPFILALVSFSLIWILGFGGLSIDPVVQEAQLAIENAFGFSINSASLILLFLILINGTLGLLAAFGAIGEELGWRGFLVPELYKHFTYTKTSFISGAIWAVYHYPLLILLMAPRLEISAIPLLISTLIGGIALTFILNWFRIKSGSVWTAVLFHAALNSHNQGFFQNLTTETSWLTNYISGEYGFMVAIVSVLVAILFWRMRKSLPAKCV